MWKFTVELDDSQLAELLYRIAQEKLVSKLGWPQFKEVDGIVVCEYEGLPDIEKVEKIVLGGVELERSIPAPLKELSGQVETEP
jgi:hypothetical protein